MLERMSFFNDGVEHPTTNHFANSPKLTHARTFESSALLLPWRQITNLQESGCQAPHILQKIKSCPHLRDLAILDVEDYQFEFDEGLKTSSDLLSLAISISTVRDDDWGLPHLLNGLTLPSLISLEISCTAAFNVITEFRESRTWSQLEFQSLLHRSDCPLQTLILENIPCSYYTLIDTLDQLPSLTTLRIVNGREEHELYPVTCEFLDILVWPGLIRQRAFPSMPMLPRLAHIDFTFHTCSTGQLHLLDLISSRWNPVKFYNTEACVKLESVKLVINDGACDVQLVDFLDGLRKEGLQVSNLNIPS